jgi:hypothetical protein
MIPDYPPMGSKNDANAFRFYYHGDSPFSHRHSPPDLANDLLNVHKC